MKFIKSKIQYIKESQAKKLKKHLDFTVFFEWFNKQRPYLAKIYDVPIDSIVSEEDILKQSSDLINKIINTQTRGNTGRTVNDGTKEDLTGFKKFNELKYKIIHDILHNLYNIEEKEFDKSEENLEFSESEIIEEIEVLAIEEVYSKYFNYRYPKPDFINQNINRLVSFLMMAIIKNDPNRIVKILDGEVEPYIEVYGKNYNVKDTPFENIFKVFEKIPIDPMGNETIVIKDSNDFKEFIKKMAMYSDMIDDYGDSSDRGEFPNPWVLGRKSFSDLTKDELEVLAYNNKWKLYDEEFEIFKNVPESEYEFHINNIFYYFAVFELPDELNLTFENIDVDEDFSKEIADIIKEELGENINLKKINGAPETLFNNLGIIEIDNIYINKPDDTDSKYFNIYELNGDSFRMCTEELFFTEEDGVEKVKLDEVDFSEILVDYDEAQEAYWEDEVDYDFDEIKKEDYLDEFNNKTFEENLNHIKYNTFSSLVRRYFRYDSTIVNTTKIFDKSPKDYYLQQNYDFDEYKSLGKNLFTDNAIRLKYIMDKFLGWAVKNKETLKQRTKDIKFLKDEKVLKVLKNLTYEYVIDLEKELSQEFEEVSNDIKNNAYDINHNKNKYAILIDSYEEMLILKNTFRKIKKDNQLKFFLSIPGVNNLENAKKIKDYLSDNISLEKLLNDVKAILPKAKFVSDKINSLKEKYFFYSINDINQLVKSKILTEEDILSALSVLEKEFNFTILNKKETTLKYIDNKYNAFHIKVRFND
jgi:hypothetical protein